MLVGYEGSKTFLVWVGLKLRYWHIFFTKRQGRQRLVSQSVNEDDAQWNIKGRLGKDFYG